MIWMIGMIRMIGWGNGEMARCGNAKNRDDWDGWMIGMRGCGDIEMGGLWILWNPFQCQPGCILTDL